MSIKLSSGHLEQLASAQQAIASLLAALAGDEKAELKGCNGCYGTCSDACTGCLSCSDTSKVG
jgi:hypothetical protein